MSTKIPRSLICPDCNVPMKFLRSFEERITPPSGTSSEESSALYGGEVDEFGYGSRIWHIYICPNCKNESHSPVKFEE